LRGENSFQTKKTYIVTEGDSHRPQRCFLLSHALSQRVGTGLNTFDEKVRSKDSVTAGWLKTGAKTNELRKKKNKRNK
jgi:hypothetical protein